MSTPNTGKPGEGTGEPPKDAPPQDNNDKNPTGTQPANDAGEGDAGKPAPKTFTQDEVNRLLAKDRREFEKKVRDAEEKAKLSEQERLQKEADDLRSQIKERDARDAVQSDAAKLGSSNPAAVYKLVKDDLEFDDKGQIKNLNEVLAEAKDLYPQLFGTVKPDGAPPDAGEGKNGDGKLLTKEQIEKMSRAEINAQWELVQKSMAAFKK